MLVHVTVKYPWHIEPCEERETFGALHTKLPSHLAEAFLSSGAGRDQIQVMPQPSIPALSVFLVLFSRNTARLNRVDNNFVGTETGLCDSSSALWLSVSIPENRSQQC
eukprot:4769728-Amphidinium_carterae.1